VGIESYLKAGKKEIQVHHSPSRSRKKGYLSNSNVYLKRSKKIPGKLFTSPRFHVCPCPVCVSDNENGNADDNDNVRSEKKRKRKRRRTRYDV
jgi:hypothetical protein